MSMKAKATDNLKSNRKGVKI